MQTRPAPTRSMAKVPVQPETQKAKRRIEESGAYGGEGDQPRKSGAQSS
jgi:hypothetical protein